MPIKIEDGTEEIVEIRAIGKLTKEDFTAFVAEFEDRVHRLGKLRVLFDVTDFHGWRPDGIWEEIKFDWKHNSDYRRLAVIGDEKWHHLLAAAFKPFTFAEVRYFSPPQSDQARLWLLKP